MEVLHADLIGPIASSEGHVPALVTNALYALVTVEEYSRLVTVIPLRTKSEGTTALLNVIRQLQVQTGKTLRQLHTDGGTEFTAQTIASELAKAGTVHTITTPHSPALNGIVERMNRTIGTMMRAMLHHASAQSVCGR